MQEQVREHFEKDFTLLEMESVYGGIEKPRRMIIILIILIIPYYQFPLTKHPSSNSPF